MEEAVSPPGRLRQVWRSYWPLAAGLTALAVYGMTLARGAYPGHSASLIAITAGLVPERLAAHPLWSLASGGLARLPGLPLATTLNAFSALCAACAVGLTGFLVERWLTRVIRTACDGEAYLPPADDAAEERPAVCPAPSAEDARYRAAARIGGWTAALALAFSVPFWSAATRLHVQTFDVLLLLVAAAFVQAHTEVPKLRLALAAAAVCGFGCVETPIFIICAPFIFFILLCNQLRAELPWERHQAAALLTAAAAAAAALLLLCALRMPEMGGVFALRRVGAAWAREHLAALGSMLPTSGWVWVLLVSAGPFLVFFFAAERLFAEYSASATGLLAFLTATVFFCLFNIPLAAWGRGTSGDALPVATALAGAAAAGYLAAYWRLRREVVALRQGALDEEGARPWTATGLAWLGWGVSWGLAAAVFAAAARNLGTADGRKGAFARALAADVLDRLEPRTWLISNGVLDHHVLILAKERRREVRLVSLAYDASAPRQKRLRQLIDSEPDFVPLRARLYNAAALGPLPLARELLAADADAARRFRVMGAPELWSMAGYRPLPAGVAYAGVRDLARADRAALPRGDDVLWRRLAVLLAPEPGARLSEPTERLRAVLRREAGRAANTLGVALEDLGRPGEAFDAYEAARRIDPRNLSALVNAHALTVHGTREALRPALERLLRARFRQDKVIPPDHVIVSSYGDIRAPRILSHYSQAWSRLGQVGLARAELDRALALDPDHIGLRFKLASLALGQDHAAEGARSYREILKQEPTNRVALTGMAVAALADGRLEEAGDWLERARLADAPAAMTEVPASALLAASGRTGEALARLQETLDAQPGNLEAWALLADLLLRHEKAFDDVERRVLPAMIRAAGTQDHVLIHLVRASLLCARKPVDFSAARMSLLRVLKLRPDLASVQNDLLQLDFALGDAGVIERDAAEVLRLAPDHPLANYLLGTVLLERGELARAEDRFRRSLAVRPTAQAYNDLAETLRRLRRLEEAEQAVREALVRNERSYAAWDTLACVLCDRDRLAEAEAAATRSLALFPGNPRTHLTLARILLVRGRHAEACKVLRRALLHVPDLPDDVVRDRDTLTARCAR